MPVSDQGVQRNRFQVIPRVLIFIFKDDEVLLLKGSPNKRIWANLYNGIGGHVEQGEPILAAARRELREETGLEVQDLSLCGTVVVDTDENPGIILFIHKGTYQGGQLVASREGSLEWVKLGEIPGKTSVEDLPILVEKIAAFPPGGRPFSGFSRYDSVGKLVLSFT